MQGGYPAGSQPPDPNLPQPPDPSQQQQGPPEQPMTLGQANEPPGNPFLEQFLQMHQMLDQQAQKLKQPYIPAPPPVNPGVRILEGLGTFGISELKRIADENTRGEQNYIIHQHNMAIDQHTNDMALKATDAQATAAGLAGKANLAQMMAQLHILEFQNKMIDQAHRYGREQVQDQVPLPKSPEEADMRDAQGLEQDPQHPNKMRLRQNPQTGAWEAPAAGSPMAAALGGGGGGAPDTGRPGELPQDVARRKAAAAKGLEKTTTEDAAAAAETMRNMKLVESWLKDPMFDQAVKDMPGGSALSASAGSVIGPARAYLARKGGSPGATYLGTANTNVMPALRAMEAGAKNMRIAGQVLGDFGVKKQMTQLQNYRMSQPEAQQFKKTLLDRFKQIRQQLGTGDATPDSTTDTATSTTPPSTVGAPTQPTGATGVTPGGVRFRVIQ